MGAKFSIRMAIAGFADTPEIDPFEEFEGVLTSAFEAARTQALVFMALDILIFGPLLAVAAAVVYHDLRHGKEGVATAELIRVFE